MSWVAAKALFFRYVYTLRHRLSTIFCVLVFLLCMFLIFFGYQRLHLYFLYGKFIADDQTYDEDSLTVIQWQLQVVVWPDGSEERQLVEGAQKILRFRNDSGNGPPLNVTYVKTKEEVTRHLDELQYAGRASISRGLLFHEITNKTLEYTIRPVVPKSLSPGWGAYLTGEKFPHPMDRGPRLKDQYFDVYFDDGKFVPGLIQLQVAIDQAYVKTRVSNDTLQWRLSSFPYPPFDDSTDFSLLSVVIPLRSVFLAFFQILLPVGVGIIAGGLITNIIKEKVSGVRELLSMNGAPRWMVNTSWLVSCLIDATVLTAAEILIIETTKGPSVVQYLSSSVLAIALIVLNWSSIFWASLIASVLTSETLYSAVTVVNLILTILILLIPPDLFILHGLVAVFPIGAFVLITKAYQEFDGAQTELGLDQLFTSPIHYLSVGTVLIIAIVSMIVVFILTIYVDLVKPGPFGRAMPWYIFTRKEKSRVWPTDEAAASHDDTYFERIDSNYPIGLKCVNIYKVFGKHIAVDNVSMNILKNRITVLLGYNGAGKSTLFSILCGMYSPTRGHFYTEHYNVFENNNIKRFRRALGYCPQDNLLMDELTVTQHLVIFALLKGLSLQAAREYSDQWTARFNMEGTRRTRVKKLSGGMKRKVSLAIAMIGEPEYLLLDEPSSGLDPESTKQLWNIILQAKDAVTVVLSTHNMDEAQTLGDCIAFMGSGQLKAYGSTPFLKMKLEAGYKLDCATDEKELTKFLAAVRRISPSASILHLTNRTVTYEFPSNKQKDIPNIMKSLDSEFGNKVALSLSQSTMDDVFIKILKRETKVSLENLVKQETEKDHPQNSPLGQLKELLKKRMKWLLYRRLIVMIIFIFGLPALGMVLSMYVINELRGFYKFPDLKFTLDEYSGSTAITSRTNIGPYGDMGGPLKLALRSSGIHYEETDKSVVEVLKEKAKEDLFHYRSKIVFAFESLKPTAYFSRNTFHSAPIAYSAMINALLHGKAAIVTHSYPYEPTIRVNYRACSSSSPFKTIIYGLIIIVFFLSMLSIAVSYFIIFPHQERQSLFKHLQFMTGLLPVTYWISNLIFDMFVFLLSCISVLVILAIMDNGLFSDLTVTGAITAVLILYGFNVILFVYIWSFLWCRTPTVLLWYLAVTCIAPLLYLILLISMIRWVMYTLPWFPLMNSFLIISVWAGLKIICDKCKEEDACELIRDNPLFSKLKKELISFVCMSFVYFGVLLALDHGLGRRLMAVIRLGVYKGYPNSKGETNPEVAKEKKRVKNLETASRRSAQPGLVCDGLGMKYSCKTVAVHEVTFATERGELFGLLGANGAGKTSTFGMLAGLISPMKGDATIGGQWRLGDCEHKYIKNIGYCPQFEGLLLELSGRTTLHLFGRFRKVKLDELDSHVEQWLEVMDMTSLADRPCGQYSGGNKRKLSFALAMIGSPPVVLLDEPTAGIDPVIRRRIWEILMLSLREHKQTIILTSHTMSECEAICDRLTILVKGEMKCLGPIPKLKNTYGKSCRLQVKLIPNITQQETNTIKSRISSEFSGHIKLQETHHNILSFNISTENLKIYDVFAATMNIKDGSSAIEDFSLSETPLEDIFLMFAKNERS